MDTGGGVITRIIYPAEILNHVNGNEAAILGLLINNQNGEGMVKVSTKAVSDLTGFHPRKIQRITQTLMEKELITKRHDGYMVSDEIRQKCRLTMLEGENDLTMVEEIPDHSKTTKMSPKTPNDKNDASDKNDALLCSGDTMLERKINDFEGKNDKNDASSIASDKNVANDKNVASNDKNDVLLCSEQEFGNPDHSNATNMSFAYGVRPPKGGLTRTTQSRSARLSREGGFLESKKNTSAKQESSAKKKTNPCPKKYKPLIEYYYEAINRKVPADHTRGLANIGNSLRRLFKGTLFNDDDAFAEYHNHPFTEKEVFDTIGVHLMALSPKFLPKDKKNLRRAFNDYLYCPFATQKSYFIRWLTEKPAPVSLRRKDENPDITKIFLTQFPDGVNDREYNKLVDAAARTVKYFKTAPIDSISRPEMAEIVIRSIEEYSGGNLKIHPGFYNSDQTFNKRIPDYLDEKGYIMASDTIQDRNERIAGMEASDDDDFMDMAGLEPLLRFQKERDKEFEVNNADHSQKSRSGSGETDNNGLDNIKEVQS